MTILAMFVGQRNKTKVALVCVLNGIQKHRQYMPKLGNHANMCS